MANFDLTVLLLAKDMASKTIGKVRKEVGLLGKMGATASRGVTTLAGNLGKLGVVAAAGIGVAVKSGIQSLATLESATTSVAGAISQMGLAGQVSAQQVATWANDIEGDIGAAFDDKDITAATATLIRFGKVTPGNLQPAMVVMTDLAAKTGDVDSAASLLAKALADPTKAAGKLARQGIVLAKAQQKQIAALMEAGDVAGAQAVILRELEKTTKGAAAATQGPYQRALSTLQDVTEDAQRALAEGFLPVLMKVADLLKGALNDPATMQGIRDFGKTLASGLDSLIEIARNLPWKQIGDSLKIAGAGAKAVLSAFSSLPPWVQTAVLTGWGLNKLTGGALSGIVGELGKGLIKGVLGMTAGVVHIKAGTVIGGGGNPLTGGPKGGPAGALPAAGAAGGIGAAGLGTLVAGIATPIIMNLLIPYLTKGPQGSSGPTLATNTNPAFATTAVLNTLAQQMTATARGTAEVRDRVSTVSADIRNGFTVQESAIRNGFTVSTATTRAGDERTGARIASLNQATQNTTVAIRNGFNVSRAATAVAGARTAAATDRAAAAIRAKRMSVSVSVPINLRTNISVRDTTTATQIAARYGKKVAS